MSDQTILQQFAGQPLSDVAFVQEFTQLAFGELGLGMTVTAPMSVVCDGATICTGEDHFKTSLSEQVGKTVSGLEYQDQEALVINLDDGSTVSISMKTKAYETPEAVLVFGDDEQTLSLP